MSDISYQSKDITSKVLAERFEGKSFSVYGLDIPKIKKVLPTNLPAIEANEMRIDNLFLLEDGIVAIIDYESAYKTENKIKYLSYITRVLKRYEVSGELKGVKIRMIVIYTADVAREETEDEFNAGCITMEIESAYLSELNSEEIMHRLQTKVDNDEPLSDEELMEFIILPLTHKGKGKKKTSLRETIELAKKLKDEDKAVFVLSGIVVFSDKIIDDETANEVKEWIKMTKVEKLFAEDTEKARAEAEVQRSRAERAEAELAKVKAELALIKANKR